MTLTPAAAMRPPSLYITPNSAEGVALGQGIAGVSTVWSLANRAIYVPVYIPQPIQILRMLTCNGLAASGNVDVGVYLPDANNLPGARLISKGTTAMAGATQCQYFDVTDTPCSAGLVYLAIACDNTTAAFWTYAPSLQTGIRSMGVMSQDSAFPLPSSATPVTAVPAARPLIGIVRTTSP